MLLYILLAVIAALLFYKLVERRHKVLVAKAVGAITILMLLVATLVSLQEHQAMVRQQAVAKEQLASVSVLFIPPGDDAIRWRKSSDTVGGALFQLCNHGNRRVTSMAFLVSTYEAHRSTPHELQVMTPWEIPGAARMPWDTSSQFHSDYILDPHKCVALNWTGWFQVFDSVSVAVTDVKY